jgi:hypothetical protein
MRIACNVHEVVRQHMGDLQPRLLARVSRMCMADQTPPLLRRVLQPVGTGLALACRRGRGGTRSRVVRKSD